MVNGAGNPNQTPLAAGGLAGVGSGNSHLGKQEWEHSALPQSSCILCVLLLSLHIPDSVFSSVLSFTPVAFDQADNSAL